MLVNMIFDFDRSILSEELHVKLKYLCYDVTSTVVVV